MYKSIHLYVTQRLNEYKAHLMISIDGVVKELPDPGQSVIDANRDKAYFVVPILTCIQPYLDQYGNDGWRVISLDKYDNTGIAVLMEREYIEEDVPPEE